MDAPLDFDSWQGRVERVEAEPLAERAQLRVGSFDRVDGVEYRLEDRDRSLDVIAEVGQLGQHSFPPRIEVVDLRDLFDRPAEEVDPPAFRPPHLALHPPLGDLTGWMGSRAYSADWDGGEFWGHVGSPTDSGGDRPVYHGR